MSEEAAEKITISLGGDAPLGDSSSQQEITVDQQHPHMSIDELLKVIKGANGMPVLLFVPSSDGRLAAVAVDGVQNLVTTTSNSKDSGAAEKNQQDYRAWLLLLTSLAATVTFTAGLTPPGGFWAADDKAKGYFAGTPVMGDIFPRRYLVFCCCNTTAFFLSLLIIVMLANNKSNPKIMLFKKRVFRFLVGVCYLSLGLSYISGTMTSLGPLIYTFTLCVAVFYYIFFSSLKAHFVALTAVLLPYLYSDK